MLSNQEEMDARIQSIKDQTAEWSQNKSSDKIKVESRI
jgi:hypothetical protein